MQNVLSRELCAAPLDLFYSNDAVIHTAKSILLNEIEIKRYSLPSLWEILAMVQLSLISIYISTTMSVLSILQYLM